MLSQAKLNIFIRVIKRRMERGESLDEILADYSKLTLEEVDALREAIENKN